MTEPTYPYADGDVTVLGPEIFASTDGDVISWKGDNYVRQAATSAGAAPATGQAAWTDAAVAAGVLSRRAATDQAAPGCPDPIQCSHEAALGEAQQQARRLGLMVDEYGAGASALTDKLRRAREMHRETCILAKGQVPPTAFTCGMCEVLDAPAAAVLPAPAEDHRLALSEALGLAKGITWAVSELHRVAAESAPATAPRPVPHAPGKVILCPDCRDKGHSACMADEQPAAAQQPETPALFCVCGAPAHRDGDRWAHQPGTGDHCLYRPNARPRCPDCRLPHDLTPGGMAMRACASILASIADRDAAAQQPKEARP